MQSGGKNSGLYLNQDRNGILGELRGLDKNWWGSRL
jgi:hypothetical protein